MRNLLLLTFFAFHLFSCADIDGEENNKNYQTHLDESNESSEHEEYDLIQEPEGYPDGRYTATVDYYNPETEYYATYTLDVEVEDNYVTIIYFNNGGYLDYDHIDPSELNENGNALIEGEEGKTYNVQINY
jgi:hypothetical protein